MRRSVLLGCGVLSSIGYVVADLVASRRYEGYSYRDFTFSELLATGAPTRPLMIALVAIPYTPLVVAFAAGVAGDVRAPARRTGLMLFGYALAGMAGGLLFPANPRDVDASWRNLMHIPMTLVMSVCILLAMAFGSTLLDRRFRVASWGTMAILVVFGTLTSLQGGAMARNEPTPWMGIEERVNIYATMLWIAALAIGLLRRDRGLSRAVGESGAAASGRGHRTQIV